MSISVATMIRLPGTSLWYDLRTVLGLISKYKSLLLLEILEDRMHIFNESFLLPKLSKIVLVGFQIKFLTDFKAECNE